MDKFCVKGGFQLIKFKKIEIAKTEFDATRFEKF